MDVPFDITRWQPTLPSRAGDRGMSVKELKALSTRLAEQTKTILRHPYDPENWLERSMTLRELQYRELATGDAYKARLLCAQLLSRLDSEEKRVWRLGHARGFWMLESGRRDEGLRERLGNLSERARKAEEKNLSGAKEEGKGKFCPRQYPWLEAGRLCRSDELVGRMNGEFDTNAHAVLNAPSFCEIRRHAFGNTGSESKDTLGVFAKRAIPKNTTVLSDHTRIWGCIGPGSLGDRTNLHGGTGCGDPVHPNLPAEAASLDLRWIRDQAGKDASVSLVLCRLLLAAITDNGTGTSPFAHHLIARLTPSYRPDGPAQTFYRRSDYEIPVRALQQFGVDVFADLEWDTWVVFTVFARLENNSCGCVVSEAVMPLFSAFNHSCEPNVAWARDVGGPPLSVGMASVGDGELGDQEGEDEGAKSASGDVGPQDDAAEEEESGIPSLAAPGIDHATTVVTTLRDVQEGEQLFVEYDSFAHDTSVVERRERLRKWLVGDCMCTRCVREAAAEDVVS